jgi:hypothetical protein
MLATPLLCIFSHEYGDYCPSVTLTHQVFRLDTLQYPLLRLPVVKALIGQSSSNEHGGGPPPLGRRSNAKKIDSVFAGEMNNYSSATHPTPFPEAKT